MMAFFINPTFPDYYIFTVFALLSINSQKNCFCKKRSFIALEEGIQVEHNIASTIAGVPPRTRLN